MSDATTDDLKTDDLKEVGPWGQAVAISFRFLLFGAVAIAIGWLVSNIRQVPADSQAVIVRFGIVARVQGPGLLLAWPKPIEQVVLIPGGARQMQLPIDRFVDGAPGADRYVSILGYVPSDQARLNSGFLLTGDSSVVHLVAQIYYQITDPAAYVIAQDHVAPALQRLFISSTVDAVAGRDLDTILVARPEIAARNEEAARRERLRADLVNAVNLRLRALAAQDASLGVTVSRVDLVPSIPGGAKDAFDGVLVVTQEAEQGIANARTLAEQSMQEANQTKDHITTDATARAEEVVSNATVATASIAALGHNDTGMSQAMQMSRLYYDRIGPIVKKAGHVEIVAKDGTTRLLLPGANR
ncbi:MAG TPA: SPFH domain-containing protein [Rhizomicrobium sp.]|nr:SPFH domain-containing protein [Rhizomicrobium sp.]